MVSTVSYVQNICDVLSVIKLNCSCATNLLVQFKCSCKTHSYQLLQRPERLTVLAIESIWVQLHSLYVQCAAMYISAAQLRGLILCSCFLAQNLHRLRWCDHRNQRDRQPCATNHFTSLSNDWLRNDVARNWSDRHVSFSGSECSCLCSLNEHMVLYRLWMMIHILRWCTDVIRLSHRWI